MTRLTAAALPPMLDLGTVDEPSVAFERILRQSRMARLSERVEAQLLEGEPSPEHDGEIAIPHLVATGDPPDPLLIWERMAPSATERLLGAGPDTVARWAKRPDLLARLAHLSLAAHSPVSLVPGTAHLSFRWVLANEHDVAALLSGQDVVLDHISLHLSDAEAVTLVRILTDHVGLIEIERPASIPTPGYWLACGDARLHLSTRDRKSREAGFPGPAPNHVCFGVTDLEAVAAALEAAGIETVAAGSLGDQLWIRAPGDTVVEFQRRWS